MAQKKISELGVAASIVGSDILPVVESSVTKKVIAEKIALVRALTDTRFKSLRITPESTKLGGTKDPDFAVYKKNAGGTSQGVFVYYFDKTTEEELFFSYEAPLDWKEGSDMFIEIYWTPKVNGGVGLKVCWGIEHTFADEGEVFGVTTLHYQDTATIDEDLLVDKHYRSELCTHPGAGLKIGHIHVCRMFRDATSVGGTDDYDDDAVLLGIGIRYEADGIGASTKDAK